MRADAQRPPTTGAALRPFDLDETALHRVLSRAMCRGGTFADVFLQYTTATTVGLEDGRVDRARSRVDRGAGIRVVVGDQTGYAFTEDLDPTALLRAAETAAAIAAAPPVTVPRIAALTPVPDVYPAASPWSSVGVDRTVPLLARIDARCRALDPRVTRVSATLAGADSLVVVAMSNGDIVADRRPMTRIGVSITAERGRERQANGATMSARADVAWVDDERVETLCRRAVERTTILFDAVRPPAGELPVVLAAGSAGILLHEAIGHGLEADFNRTGVSIFAGRCGSRVASPLVSIVDDGTILGMRGSLNVDDEGVPGQRTVLVEEGILRGYLHDRISAAHFGAAPTGSGRRQSFRHPPLPRMRNTAMLPGPHDRDEIVASVRRGILAETFTNGQVEIGAGDFTFYIKTGFLIEDGAIVAPIKDANIIGNGPEVLRRITMVADDLLLDDAGWTCGKAGQSVPVSLGLPTTLVSGITVGGMD